MKTITINTTSTSDFFGLYSFGINDKTYHRFMNDYDKVDLNEDLTINLVTQGGSLSYSLQIANIIKNHKGRTIAKVERYALSGGSLIALTCDEIHLDRCASLGPIDPQNSLLSLPINKLLPSLELYKDDAMYYNFGYHYFKNIENSFLLKLKKLLDKFNDDQMNELLKVFYNGCDHNLPIFADELPNFLNIRIFDHQVKNDSEGEIKNRLDYDSLYKNFGENMRSYSIPKISSKEESGKSNESNEPEESKELESESESESGSESEELESKKSESNESESEELESNESESESEELESKESDDSESDESNDETNESYKPLQKELPNAQNNLFANMMNIINKFTNDLPNVQNPSNVNIKIPLESLKEMKGQEIGQLVADTIHDNKDQLEEQMKDKVDSLNTIMKMGGEMINSMNKNGGFAELGSLMKDVATSEFSEQLEKLTNKNEQDEQDEQVVISDEEHNFI